MVVIMVMMVIIIIIIILSGHVVIVNKEPKSKYRRAPLSTDSVSTVHHGLKKKLEN
jgi:hypothetical protein